MKSLTKKQSRTLLITVGSVLLALILVLSGVGIYFKVTHKEKTPPAEINPLDFSVDTWDGTVSASAFNEAYAGRSEKTKTINSASAFAHFINEVNNGNSFEGYTVYLNSNIDFKNKKINPIGTQTNPFKGTFDGGHYTLLNANVNGTALFENTENATIKNIGLYNSNASLINLAVNTNIENTFVRLGEGKLVEEFVSNNGNHSIKNSFVDNEGTGFIGKLDTDNSQENEVSISNCYFTTWDSAILERVGECFVVENKVINPTTKTFADWSYSKDYSATVDWCDYDYREGSQQLDFKYPLQSGFVKVFLTGSCYESVVVAGNTVLDATNLPEAFKEANKEEEAEVNLLVEKIFMEARAEATNNTVITVNTMNDSTIVRGENNEDSLFVSTGNSKIILGEDSTVMPTGAVSGMESIQPDSLHSLRSVGMTNRSITSTLTLDGNRDYFEQNDLDSGALVVSYGGYVELNNNVIIKDNINNTTKNGGAVLVYNSPEVPKIDATFENCSSEENGGGVAIVGTPVEEIGASFYSCSAKGSGGALYVGEISQSSISAMRTLYGKGLAVQPTTYDDNGTKGNAGVIIDNDAQYVECNASDWCGGAIAAYSTVYISGNPYFCNNSVTELGGAIYCIDLVVSGSPTFENNYSGMRGGAICVDTIGDDEYGIVFTQTSKADLWQSTAPEGGAIYAACPVVIAGDVWFRECGATNNGDLPETSAAICVDNGNDLIITGSPTFTANLGKDIYLYETSSILDTAGNVYIYGNPQFIKTSDAQAETAIRTTGNVILDKCDMYYFPAGLGYQLMSGNTLDWRNFELNMTFMITGNPGAGVTEYILLKESGNMSLTFPVGGKLPGSTSNQNVPTMTPISCKIVGDSSNITITAKDIETNGETYSDVATVSNTAGGSGSYLYVGAYDWLDPTGSIFVGNVRINNNGDETSYLNEYNEEYTSAVFSDRNAWDTPVIYAHDVIFNKNSNAVFARNSTENGPPAIMATGDIEIYGNPTFQSNFGHMEYGAIYATNINISGNPTFIGNSSDSGYGAVYATGDIEISGNPTFQENWGTSGAIKCEDLTISGNPTFERNGGWNGTVQATNITIDGNPSFLNNKQYNSSMGRAIYAENITINGNPTFSNCSVSGTGTAGNGGAIYASGDVTISGDATFSGNTASNGGAIYAAGDVSISGNPTFTGNSVTQYEEFAPSCGGAICANGDVTISGDAIFSGNNAEFEGGAIYAVGDVNIAETNAVPTFKDNEAGSYGGAICASNVVIETEVIFGGSAEGEGNGAGSYGGAIRATGNVTISSDASFIKNNAGTDGGGAICANGDVTISGDATFVGCHTNYYGGAIYADGDVEITGNVVFASNTAEDGGAIYAYGNVTLDDSNSAKEDIVPIGVDGIPTGFDIDWSKDFSMEFYFQYEGGTVELLSAGSSSDGTYFAIYADSSFIYVDFGQAGDFWNTLDVYLGQTKYKFTINYTASTQSLAFDVYDEIIDHWTWSWSDCITSDMINKGSKDLIIGACLENSADGTTKMGEVKITQDGKTHVYDPTGMAFINNTASSNGGAVFAINTTITGNPIFTGNTVEGEGGAILTSGDVVISGDATFIGNSASTGGAICVLLDAVASLTLSGDATFEGNTASENGGAVWVEGGVTISVDATFTGNSASENGGAIYADGGVEITGNVVFASNTAGSNGGAICSGSKITISGDAEFSKNQGVFGALYAPIVVVSSNAVFDNNFGDGESWGGAISATQLVEISGSPTFKNHDLFGGGGAIYCYPGDVLISGNPTFSDNRADFTGAIDATNVNITGNPVFSNNQSGDGVAINATGNVIISGAPTFEGNSTEGSGGAISAQGDVVITEPMTHFASDESKTIAMTNNLYEFELTFMLLNSEANTTIFATDSGRLFISNGTPDFFGNGTTKKIPANTIIQVKATYESSTEEITLSICDLATNGGVYSVRFSMWWDYSYTQSFILADGEGDDVLIGKVFVGGSEIYSPTVNAKPSFIGNSALNGGAINAEGNVKIYIDAIFGGSADGEGNTATSNGGAIYAGGDVLIAGDAKFIENSAAYDGAIHAEGSVVISGNAEFDGNSMENGDTGSGAVYAAGNVTISGNAKFNNNYAYCGGAISATNVVISGAPEFTGNNADDSGGAIYATGEVVIDDSMTYLTGAVSVSDSISVTYYDVYTQIKILEYGVEYFVLGNYSSNTKNYIKIDSTGKLRTYAGGSEHWAATKPIPLNTLINIHFQWDNGGFTGSGSAKDAETDGSVFNSNIGYAPDYDDSYSVDMSSLIVGVPDSSKFSPIFVGEVTLDYWDGNSSDKVIKTFNTPTPATGTIKFEGNCAGEESGYGGAIYANKVYIKDVTINASGGTNENFTAYSGGAIYGSVEIFGKAEIRNGGTEGGGAGIYGNVTVSGEALFQGNSTYGSGGAIYGSLTVTSTGKATFRNNVAGNEQSAVDGSIDVAGEALFEGNESSISVVAGANITGTAIFRNNICGDACIWKDVILNGTLIMEGNDAAYGDICGNFTYYGGTFECDNSNEYDIELEENEIITLHAPLEGNIGIHACYAYTLEYDDPEYFANGGTLDLVYDATGTMTSLPFYLAYSAENTELNFNLIKPHYGVVAKERQTATLTLSESPLSLGYTEMKTIKYSSNINGTIIINGVEDKLEIFENGSKISTKTHAVTAGTEYEIVVTGENVGSHNLEFVFQPTDVATHKASTTTLASTVTPKSIALPTASSTTFKYDGTEKTYLPANWNSISAYVDIVNNTRTNVGTQTVNLILKDAENTVWADGTITDKQFTFTIGAGQLSAPTNLALNGWVLSWDEVSLPGVNVSYQVKIYDYPLMESSVVFETNDTYFNFETVKHLLPNLKHGLCGYEAYVGAISNNLELATSSANTMMSALQVGVVGINCGSGIAGAMINGDVVDSMYAVCMHEGTIDFFENGETTTCTISAILEEGYQFAGWATDSSSISFEDVSTVQTQVTFTVNMMFSGSITANALPTGVNVTFAGNGGNVEYNSKAYDPAGTYGTLPTALRTGYTFNGWKLGESTIDITSEVPDTDHVLVADWTAKQFTVTLNANGGVFEGGTTKTITVTYDAKYGDALENARLDLFGSDGYSVNLGWFTSATGGIEITPETIVTALADHALYVHWARGSIDLEFSYNSEYGMIRWSDETTPLDDECTISIPLNSKVHVANNVLTIGDRHLIAIPKESTAQYEYAFAGWSLSEGAVIGEDSVSFSGSFSRSERSYKVKVVIGDTINEITATYGTTVKIEGNKITIGTTTYTATQTGKTFNKWVGAVGVIEGAVTITADFSERQMCTVTFDFGSLNNDATSSVFQVELGTQMTCNHRGADDDFTWVILFGDVEIVLDGDMSCFADGISIENSQGESTGLGNTLWNGYAIVITEDLRIIFVETGY